MHMDNRTKDGNLIFMTKGSKQKFCVTCRVWVIVTKGEEAFVHILCAWHKDLEGAGNRGWWWQQS